MLQFAVRVRTSTDRTGCTNFFREKCTFYGQGWTIGSMFTKPRTLRPPGRAVLCVAPEYPKVGTLVFFCLVPEYTENFAERVKKRQNCNGKRKIPSLVAELQQQGQRGNRILNKTAERIIMRKKLKKEGRSHGTGISARTVQRPSCGLDERAQHQLTGACQGNRLLQEYHQPLHQRCERNPDP